MSNPQNTQYFGKKTPYPLELGAWHRFLIPMYGNAMLDEPYAIYIIDGDNRNLIAGKVFIENGFFKYISFKSEQSLSGRIEIVNQNTGKTVYYSNCVQFMDSTDSQGRKFIRVATKHSYNRHLFEFNKEEAWIVTNLPAYCLGELDMEVEVANSRVGGNSTLRVKDSFVDEVVSYEFLSNGDGNVLNFIQAHATNNYFFIDGTQRTLKDKIERSEHSMSGTMSFVNVKDASGLNVQLDESEIFAGL